MDQTSLNGTPRKPKETTAMLVTQVFKLQAQIHLGLNKNSIINYIIFKLYNYKLYFLDDS